MGYGETVAVSLSSVDDQGNFREAVWSVSAPSQPQVGSSSGWYGIIETINTDIYVAIVTCFHKSFN